MLFAYQHGVAATMGDPKIERVTVIKSTYIGYTAEADLKPGKRRAVCHPKQANVGDRTALLPQF